MKAFLALSFVCATLTPQSCSKPTPPPATVPSAPKLEAQQGDNLSRIAAAANAQGKAIATLPASNAKAAIEGENAVIQARAGEAKPKDQADADARVIAALNGQLAEANAAWAKALETATADKQRIAELEQSVDREQKAAAEELRRQLAAARSEATQKEQLYVSLLLFGLGALCIVAAFLIGQMAVTIPQFGPRAAVGFGLAGATLIAVGIGLRVVSRMIDEHPYVFWGSILFAVLAAVVGGALIYANHKHATAQASTAAPTS